MSFDTIHIANQFAQHGDTVLTKMVNLPETQVNVNVSASDVDSVTTYMSVRDSSFVDSVYSALSDSIHVLQNSINHLDSIVNHVSTYGTDMPTEIKSFVIPILIGIVTIAFPLIFSNNLSLKSKYKERNVAELVDGNGFYLCFILAAVTLLFGLLFYCVFSSCGILSKPISEYKWVTIVFLILLYFLIGYLGYSLMHIKKIHDYKYVFKWAMDKYKPSIFNKTKNLNDNSDFALWIRDGLSTCIDYSDINTLSELIAKINEKLSFFIQKNKNNYKTMPLVFSADYYGAIEWVIKDALSRNLVFEVQEAVNQIPQKLLFEHHRTCLISEETLLCYFALLQIAREYRNLSFVDDIYIALERDAQSFPIKLKNVDIVKRTNIIALKRFAYLNGALLLAEGNKTVTGYNTNIIQAKNKQHIFPLNKEEIFLYFAYALSHADDWAFRKGYGIRMKTNDFTKIVNKLVTYTAFQLCEDELNQLKHPVAHYGTLDFTPYVGTELVKDISIDKNKYQGGFLSIVKPMTTIAPQIGLDPTKFPVPPQRLINDALQALIKAGIIK